MTIRWIAEKSGTQYKIGYGEDGSMVTTEFDGTVWELWPGEPVEFRMDIVDGEELGYDMFFRPGCDGKWSRSETQTL